MARGFESKDVEFQQAEADRIANRSAGPAAQASITPDDRSRIDHRRSVELALVRARADLRSATAAAYRAMLEQAIRTLENELEHA